MKNRKGFLFGIIPLIYLSMIIVILILLIWFGVRINGALQEMFKFLTKWWWAIGLTIFWVTPTGQGIIKWLLSKVGIKI